MIGTSWNPALVPSAHLVGIWNRRLTRSMRRHGRPGGYARGAGGDSSPRRPLPSSLCRRGSAPAAPAPAPGGGAGRSPTTASQWRIGDGESMNEFWREVGLRKASVRIGLGRFTACSAHSQCISTPKLVTGGFPIQISTLFNFTELFKLSYSYLCSKLFR